MNSIFGVLRRSGGRAVLGALLIASVLVSGVAAKNPRQLNGSVDETFTAVACPTPGPTLFCAVSAGPGTMNGLGRVTSLFLGIVNFTPTSSPGCYAVTSRGTLQARTGLDKKLSTLNVLDVGTLCQTSPTTGVVTGSFTITGGTGRFIGATGGGTYVAPTIFNSTFTGGSSAEIYTGTISLPRCDSTQIHSGTTYTDSCGFWTGGTGDHGFGVHLLAVHGSGDRTNVRQVGR